MSDRCHPHQARACRECADKPQVAVIDLANAADVGRLVWILNEDGHGADPSVLAAALTRYAAGEGLTPPKPAEPTGLGAVVEDEEGVLWTYTGLGSISPWVCPSSRGSVGGWRNYGEIAAVRVLSEGVQPDPWASYRDRDLTVEDLDALPMGSVVRDCDGNEAVRWAGLLWDRESRVCAAVEVIDYAPIRLVSVGGEGK